jgi:hypothetical protein
VGPFGASRQQQKALHTTILAWRATRELKHGTHLAGGAVEQPLRHELLGIRIALHHCEFHVRSVTIVLPILSHEVHFQQVWFSHLPINTTIRMKMHHRAGRAVLAVELHGRRVVSEAGSPNHALQETEECLEESLARCIALHKLQENSFADVVTQPVPNDIVAAA